MVPGRSPACSRYGTPLHMDGARLLEIAPWYGRDPAEIAALFDSVYLSFYKGLGGLSGAMLLGTAPFLKQATPWRRCVVQQLLQLQQQQW